MNRVSLFAAFSLWLTTSAWATSLNDIWVGIGNWISEIWHKDISVEISAEMNSLIGPVFAIVFGGICLFYSVMWFVHLGIDRVRKAKRTAYDYWWHNAHTWILIGAAFIGYSFIFLMGVSCILIGSILLFESWS